MDTLPLPPRPDLEQYKKRAKELVAAARSNDPGALRTWAKDWLAALARALGTELTPFVQGSFERATEAIVAAVRAKLEGLGGAELTLADAQFFLARAHAFASWSEFTAHVERAAGRRGETDPFERAADAVVEGDLDTLRTLLQEQPDLIRARSARTHRATLLHYAAANGVEDFRQRTSPNAVAVAKLLLESGAEVDALAETYGGGKAQTTMNLLVSSAHPAGAGLQVPLVETLLDFGAAIDGLEDNGSPVMTALAFGYVDAAEALARRGAKLDNVMSAASLGRADLVREFLADPAKIPGSLVGLDWLGLTPDPKLHLERAFVGSCAFGRTEVVELLLAHGVDPAAMDPHHMTGLHWAAANGHARVVDLLLARGAPLESKNDWCGTVLGCTLHFARQFPQDAAWYATIVDKLLAAGADPRAVRLPTGFAPIDDAFRRHGTGAS